MTESTDDIWGEAAIFLSLDCADTILELLPDFDFSPAEIRKLIREAILKNRKIHPPSIARIVQETIMQSSATLGHKLKIFIETKLAGVARDWRQEEVNSLKFFDFVNFNVEKCSEISGILSVEDLQRKVNMMFDDILARKVYECVTDNERQLAMNKISDWDREMIEKHSNLGLGVAPLKIFVDTFEKGQKIKIYQYFVPMEKIKLVENILE